MLENKEELLTEKLVLINLVKLLHTKLIKRFMTFKA